jgi:hypothetical protein
VISHTVSWLFFLFCLAQSVIFCFLQGPLHDISSTVSIAGIGILLCLMIVVTNHINTFCKDTGLTIILDSSFIIMSIVTYTITGNIPTFRFFIVGILAVGFLLLFGGVVFRNRSKNLC